MVTNYSCLFCSQFACPLRSACLYLCLLAYRAPSLLMTACLFSLVHSELLLATLPIESALLNTVIGLQVYSYGCTTSKSGVVVSTPYAGVCLKALVLDSWGSTGFRIAIPQCRAHSELISARRAPLRFWIRASARSLADAGLVCPGPCHPAARWCGPG